MEQRKLRVYKKIVSIVQETAISLFEGLAGKEDGSEEVYEGNPLQRLKEYHDSFTVDLAGGLTPENAAQAVRTVHPDVVDVSSGVEAEPAKEKGFAGKEKEKIRRFVKAVRAEK